MNHSIWSVIRAFSIILCSINEVFSLSSTTSSQLKNKIAIILNVNARSVNPSTISIAEDMMGKENVYVTSTLEDNQEVAHTILDREYDLVVPAGGDGTLSSVINAIVNAHRERIMNHDTSRKIEISTSTTIPKTKLPKFAFLPLGTGNGMGMLVGARVKGGKKKKVQNILTQLKQIVQMSEQTHHHIPTVKCPMIEITASSSSSFSNSNTYNETTISSLSPKNGQGEKPGQLCFFAGAGFDSLMLNDFNIVKRWSSNKPILKRFLGSVAGYFVALLIRTLPQCLIWGKHKQAIRITIPKSSTMNQNENENADNCENIPNNNHLRKANNKQVKSNSTYWIDPRRGDTAIEILDSTTTPSASSITSHENSKNLNDNLHQSSCFTTEINPNRQLLFEGETGIVAAATTPYYGGGLRLFPFSRMQPHTMHLRLGRIHPLIGFFNMPWIYRGTYRNHHMGCMDFVGADFEIELSKPYPFQHSGEAVQYDGINKFSFTVANEEIEFVDFLEPRLIYGYTDSNKSKR